MITGLVPVLISVLITGRNRRNPVDRKGFHSCSLLRTEMGLCSTETSQQVTVTKVTSYARPGPAKFEFMQIHLKLGYLDKW